MRYSLPTAVLLLGLVPAGVAQTESTGRILPVPRATVTHVDTPKAIEPGAVEILGTHLELITSARISGVEVPVLANDGQRILLAPPPQAPGFLSLQLAQPDRFLAETIEFTPSISGRWLGSHIRLRLNPGGAGWYILNFSYRTRPLPLVTEGVYYVEMLDMSIRYSGQLSGGLLSGETLLLPAMLVPRGLVDHGALGTARPMHVQAFTMIDGDLAFSNMYTIARTL